MRSRRQLPCPGRFAGLYSFARTAEDLTDIFDDLYVESRGLAELHSLSASIRQNETKTFDVALDAASFPVNLFVNVDASVTLTSSVALLESYTSAGLNAPIRGARGPITTYTFGESATPGKYRVTVSGTVVPGTAGHGAELYGAFSSGWRSAVGGGWLAVAAVGSWRLVMVGG